MEPRFSVVVTNKCVGFLLLALATSPAFGDGRDLLHRAGVAYASQYKAQLVAGQPVGVISPGGAFGQTFNPTPDQLKAIGVLRADARVGGDVRLEFQPAGCQRDSRICELTVRTTVGGVTTTAAVRVR